ncbi:MAG: ribonuclease P protein component [Planctomycetaceae bacterium]
MTDDPLQRLGKRFRKSQHLRKTAEFDAVYAVRQRQSDRQLLIYAAFNGLKWSRIGLSVSRKVGGSVIRQSVKRMLREAFRLVQHELPPGLDLILIPVKPAPASVAEYAGSLKQLCQRLAKRLRYSAPSSRDLSKPLENPKNAAES